MTTAESKKNEHANHQSILTEVAVADVDARFGIQIRVNRLNKVVVRDYRDDLERQAVFPPLLVYRVPNGSESQLLLIDGFHRLEAAKWARCEVIRCEIREGTYEDALLAALGSNTRHGCRLTPADKRNAIIIALSNFGRLSNRCIAKLVNVSDKTVGKVRKQFPRCGESATVRIGKDGKNYPIKNGETDMKPESPTQRENLASQPSNDSKAVKKETYSTGEEEPAIHYADCSKALNVAGLSLSDRLEEIVRLVSVIESILPSSLKELVAHVQDSNTDGQIFELAQKFTDWGANWHEVARRVTGENMDDFEREQEIRETIEAGYSND